MSSLNDLKARLKQKFGHRGKESVSLKHLPDAVDQTIQHHYEHRQQPVIVRETHNVEVKQIIQPIEDEEEIEHEHQDFARAFAYKEQLHDMAPRHVEIRDRNRNSMNLTKHETLPDVHDVVEFEPVVEERCFNHVIEEIQPVFKQKRLHRHVVTEFIPVFEKHMHVSNVSELTTASPVKKSDWCPTVSQRILHWQPTTDRSIPDTVYRGQSMDVTYGVGDGGSSDVLVFDTPSENDCSHKTHNRMATQLMSSED